MRDAVLDRLSEVAHRLSAIHGRHPDADPELVADVIRTVLGMAEDELPTSEGSLIAEVAELGRTIAAAKSEIAALKVDDINASHIPSATDELDAIVAQTASATDQILETCETLDRVGAQISGELASQLQDATTRIYEACSFQDITGQRITKVVATLKTIETKVAHMLATFGGGRPVAAGSDPSDDPDELLNGPQLPAAAMDQADIDKLLASFD